MKALSLKSLLKNKKLFGIVIVILTALTLLFNLVTLTTPYLIGYYKTSNGIVEYFSSLDPEFIIKPYLNGSNKPALISVFVNLPNKIVPLEDSFTSSLIIPFSQLKLYMNYWLPWAKRENTSLLVFVTYINSTKAYSAAEEIEYSPLWIINNEGIQVVAKVNVIGKTVPTNWSLVQHIVQKLKTNRHNYRPILAGGGSTTPFYTLNVITGNYSLPDLTGQYGDIYAPTLDYIIINNVSIPLSWVTISNNVLSSDTFNNIEVSDTLSGYVQFMAISNYSNYPYAGFSVSAYVSWNNFTSPSESALKDLNTPSLYVYYNATVAIAVYHVSGNVQGSVSIVEVTWVNPFEAGSAVESYSGYTQIYVNGLLAGYILGNGTPSLIMDFLTNNGFTIPSKVAASQLGYASWSSGSVNYTSGRVFSAPGGWKFNMLNNEYETSNYLGQVTTAADIALDVGISLIEFYALPESLAGAVIDMALTFGEDAVEFYTVPSPQVIQNFTEYSSILMSLGPNETGHVYVSYLNFSITYPIPIEGFILNYSNWYYLDK